MWGADLGFKPQAVTLRAFSTPWSLDIQYVPYGTYLGV